jgi:hypothetical protein
MILHIVLLEPRADLTPDAVQTFLQVLETASRDIPSILEVKAGPVRDLGLGYEDRSDGRGFSHAAVFGFASVDNLKAYLVHPAHQALGEQFWQVAARTLIVDVEAVDPRTASLEDIAAPRGLAG